MATTNKDTYKFSFTAGGLLYAESLAVAEKFNRLGDWKAVVEHVKKINVLQARTESAAKRMLLEVRQRLQELTQRQIYLLEYGSRMEQVHLLWLASCKRYRLLFDFASDVVREQYLRVELVVTEGRFDDFLESQSVWHPEIDRISPKTRKKICQVTIKMLRDAELLSRDSIIQPANLTREVVAAIQADDPEYFRIFPISNTDLQHRGL